MMMLFLRVLRIDGNSVEAEASQDGVGSCLNRTQCSFGMMLMESLD